MDDIAHDFFDDELDINLRSAREVAERAIIVGAICRQAFLDLDAEVGVEERTAERFDHLAWLRQEGMFDSLTEAERVWLEGGEAGPDDEAVIRSWQMEGLGVSLWSLGLLPELPPVNEMVDAATVLAKVPPVWEKTREFLASARLIDESVIAEAREVAELWCWRTTANYEELADLPEVVSEAVEAGLLIQDSRVDFVVSGSVFGQLSADEQELVAIVAEQRLLALNWLCGFGEDWDSVPMWV